MGARQECNPRLAAGYPAKEISRYLEIGAQMAAICSRTPWIQIAGLGGSPPLSLYCLYMVVWQMPCDKRAVPAQMDARGVHNLGGTSRCCGYTSQFNVDASRARSRVGVGLKTPKEAALGPSASLL